MITLRNIEKCYETRAGRTFVLRQINMDVRKGELLTIMGPSGAGKTTLLNIIGMLDGDFSGEYYLDGHAVHDISPKDRKTLGRDYVGFIFQHFHLLDDLTVAENLDIPLGRLSSLTSWTVSRSWRRRTCSRVSCQGGSSSLWRWPGLWFQSPS